MENKNLNQRFHQARNNKKDEFYTQIQDIEKEMRNYKTHFIDKVVFCNCDDPEESNFWKYFELNFEILKLKKLISTHYDHKKSTYKLEIQHDINNDGKINNLDIIKTPLKQNGDFRSPECIEILKECDIVVTNPPFSLFREYVAQLIEYNKYFIILGNQNAFTYKEIFSLFKENKIWTGIDNGGTKWFEVPVSFEIQTKAREKIQDGKKYISMGNVFWFTNLYISKRYEDLILFKKYKDNEKEYPTYDNYKAIEISTVAEIPVDYKGIMGVPITYLEKYNPNQFKIVGKTNNKEHAGKYLTGKEATAMIKGKKLYHRVLIKKVNKG